MYKNKKWDELLKIISQVLRLEKLKSRKMNKHLKIPINLLLAFKWRNNRLKKI